MRQDWNFPFKRGTRIRHSRKFSWERFEREVEWHSSRRKFVGQLVDRSISWIAKRIMMLSSSSATTPDSLKQQTSRNHPFNHRLRVGVEGNNKVVHDCDTSTTTTITLMNIPKRKKTMAQQQQQQQHSGDATITTSSLNKSTVADRLLKRRLSLERQQQQNTCSTTTANNTFQTNSFPTKQKYAHCSFAAYSKLETAGGSYHTVETTEETDVSSSVLHNNHLDSNPSPSPPPPPPMVVVRKNHPKVEQSTTAESIPLFQEDDSSIFECPPKKKRRVWRQKNKHRRNISFSDHHDAEGDDSSVSTMNLFETTTTDESNNDQKRSTTQTHAISSSSLPNIDVGTRVEIYWDGEKKYFAGTVTRRRDKNKGKPFYVVYDDGDKEWVDFSREKKFRILRSDQDDENVAPSKKKNARTKHFAATVIESSNSCSSTTDSNTKKTPILEKPPIAINRNVAVSGVPSKTTTTAPANVKAISTVNAQETQILSIPPRPQCDNGVDADWVAAGGIRKDSEDSDTDEEEVMNWACQMFGIAKIARPKSAEQHPCEELLRKLSPPKPKCDLHNEELEWLNIPMSISEKVKLGRRRVSEKVSYAPYPGKKKNPSSSLHRFMKENAADNTLEKKNFANSSFQDDDKEMKRRKEEARPLTAAEIAAILAEDDCQEVVSSWVRRSVRQPSKSALNAPKVKELLEKMRSNDSDMVVLKMKKYCSDLDTPQIVIDAALDALEENTNCEALYIQVCYSACFFCSHTMKIAVYFSLTYFLSGFCFRGRILMKACAMIR